MIDQVIKLRITKKDIEQGERKMPSSCPIARSLNRKFKGTAYVHPGSGTVASNPGKMATFLWNTDTTDWIKKYDKGDPVEPFTAVGLCHYPESLQILRSLEKVRKRNKQ